MARIRMSKTHENKKKKKVILMVFDALIRVFVLPMVD